MPDKISNNLKVCIELKRGNFVTGNWKKPFLMKNKFTGHQKLKKLSEYNYKRVPTFFHWKKIHWNSSIMYNFNYL